MLRIFIFFLIQGRSAMQIFFPNEIYGIIQATTDHRQRTTNIDEGLQNFSKPT
jgi:hypothetical protein